MHLLTDISRQNRAESVKLATCPSPRRHVRCQLQADWLRLLHELVAILTKNAPFNDNINLFCQKIATIRTVEVPNYA
jgi:hypothetical protein